MLAGLDSSSKAAEAFEVAAIYLLVYSEGSVFSFCCAAFVRLFFFPCKLRLVAKSESIWFSPLNNHYSGFVFLLWRSTWWRTLILSLLVDLQDCGGLELKKSSFSFSHLPYSAFFFLKTKILLKGLLREYVGLTTSRLENFGQTQERKKIFNRYLACTLVLVCCKTLN